MSQSSSAQYDDYCHNCNQAVNFRSNGRIVYCPNCDAEVY